MHPSKGIFNKVIEFFGGTGIDWLGNINLALFSVIATDVWKGIYRNSNLCGRYRIH